MKQLLISENIVSALLRYLSVRPWAEVNSLIVELSGLQPPPDISPPLPLAPGAEAKNGATAP